MSESDKPISRHGVSLSTINMINLLEGVARANSELDRAIIGLPKGVHGSDTYKRITRIRQELRDITVTLNPTVFLENDSPVDGAS